MDTIVRPLNSRGRKTWLITGASRGMGKAIAGCAIEADRNVVATFRDAAQARNFEQSFPNALGVVMDVTDPLSINRGVIQAEHRFGTLDVLVNNSGCGLFGAIEEVEDSALRDMMDVNFFGAIAVTQAVLPLMRRQGQGVIFQMSSISGVRALEGLGSYAASKFALEGASEALDREVAPLGIKIIVVEPGPFRTEWIGGAESVPRTEIEAYSQTAHALINRLKSMDGRQPGDPIRAAQILLKIAENPANAPFRLVLGSTALSRIAEKIRELERDLERSVELASNTDFPQVQEDADRGLEKT